MCAITIFSVYMSKPEKLLQYLKDMGYNQGQIEQFGLLLHPILQGFVSNAYASAFSDVELLAIKETAEESDYNEAQTDAYVAFCFEKKTRKSIDKMTAEYLDYVVESIEKHFKTVGKIIKKLDGRGEKDFLEGFEAHMKELESIYLDRMVRELNKKYPLTKKNKSNE